MMQGNLNKAHRFQLTLFLLHTHTHTSTQTLMLTQITYAGEKYINICIIKLEQGPLCSKIRLQSDKNVKKNLCGLQCLLVF